VGKVPRTQSKMIVFSDTYPICCLILIDQVNILQELYELVIIPQAVADELNGPESPPVLRKWITNPPDCLQIGIVSVSSRSGIEPISKTL